MFLSTKGMGKMIGIGGISIIAGVLISTPDERIEQRTQANCARILGGEPISMKDWERTVANSYKRKEEKDILHDILLWTLLLNALPQENPIYAEWQTLKEKHSEEIRILSDNDEEIRNIALKQLGELFYLGSKAYSDVSKKFCVQKAV